MSCASCFFCSSEGYGCCGHQQESPCLLGHHLVPEAWPVRSLRPAREPRLEQGPEEPARLGFPLSFPLLPEAPPGKQSRASGNYACGRPASSSN